MAPGRCPALFLTRLAVIFNVYKSAVSRYVRPSLILVMNTNSGIPMRKYLFFLLLPLFTFTLQAQNIDKRGQWKPGEFVNDVWGYDAPDGRYYAIIGAESGTYVLDVSNPANISQVGYVKGNKSIWRDIKSYKHYIYVTNENYGLDILDLSNVPSSVRHVRMMDVPGYHNVFIDTATAQMFLADAASAGGVDVYSLADPENPKFAYRFGTETHDVFVRDHIAYCAQGRKGTIGIYNLNDPGNVFLIKSLPIPDAGYVHNVWLSKNSDYMLSTEETVHKTVKIWDIRDMQSISMKGQYLANNQLAHNVQVEGDYAYVSHYESGVAVLDIHNPDQMTFVGGYDAYPADDNANYNGTWGVYPHSKSGMMYLSGDNHGLLVLQFNGARASSYAGTISDAESGEFIAGAHIHLPSAGLDIHSGPRGGYSFSTGLTQTETMRVSAFGYESRSLSIEPNSMGPDTVNVELTSGRRTRLRVRVKDPQGAGVYGARVQLRVESTLLAQPRVYEGYSNEEGLVVLENLPLSDPQEAVYTSLQADGQDIPYTYASFDTLILEDVAYNDIVVQLSTPEVLIVNGDPRGAYSDYIRQALGNIGVTGSVYELASRGTLPGAAYTDRLQVKRVIWITGDAEDEVLSNGAQDSIKDFLRSGVNVLLSGQNIAEYLQATGSSFLSDWLRVAYFANTTSNVLGVDGDHPVGSGIGQIALYAEDGAQNQTSSDLMKALTDKGASSVIWYGGSPANTAAVAVPYEEYGSKLFFAGFGIEAVAAGNENQAALDKLLGNVINWFDNISALTPPPEKVAGRFALAANYPNPFNPSTRIQYRLARKTAVRLSVFDVAGREVAVLVDGVQSPGSHAVTFQAADLTSGVYFYRLRAGSYLETRRMILLR